MKFDYLALLVIVLFGILIFIFPPFVASVNVPVYVRFPLLFFITVFFVSITFKRKKFLNTYGYYILFFIFEIGYWFVKGSITIGHTAYFFIYILLSFSLLSGIHRISGSKELMRNLFFLIVIVFSALSILSFLAYNFELLPYEMEQIGDEGYYNNFYNPLLGYISIKKFEFGTIGRVCGYLLEPSYLGWFLSVNYFLVENYVQKRKYIIICRIVVFLGAMATCSTMAWIVIPLVLMIKFFYKIMAIFHVRNRTTNMILGIGSMALLLMFLTIVPKEKLIESLGTSSADDREERADASFLLIGTSSVPDLLFGRSPGYIESNFDKGESNQIVKLIVETGLLSTVMILIFVINCTKRSKYFMIANLLFLNSVVVLLTPLFILNILVCKWTDEQD